MDFRGSAETWTSLKSHRLIIADIVAEERGRKENQMEKGKTFKVGDFCRVAIPYNEQMAGNLLRFNGCVAKITSEKRVVDGLGRMFTLEGINADSGLPYWFVRSWLKEVPEID